MFLTVKGFTLVVTERVVSSQMTRLTLLKDFSARTCSPVASNSLPGGTTVAGSTVSSVVVGTACSSWVVIVGDCTAEGVRVSAPALSGLDAMGVNPTGAGTVYGSGVVVVAGAVTVCVIVSLTVSYTVELTYAVSVLVGIPSVRGALSVTTMKRCSVVVEGTVIHSQTVLHWSGLSELTMLKVVILVVVGTLVKCRGPYVD